MSNYDYRPELEEENREEQHKAIWSDNQGPIPISLCSNCGQSWPCETEQKRPKVEKNDSNGNDRKTPAC